MTNERWSSARRSVLSCLLGIGSAGCGEVAALELVLRFSEAAAQAETQAIRVVVRERPKDGQRGCEALWGTSLPGLREAQHVSAYPSRVDVASVDVRLAGEPLTILVYAHRAVGELDGQLVASDQPIAGGCADHVFSSPGGRERVTLSLDAPP